MSAVSEYEERYLSKVLYNGLPNTPVWAREVLDEHGIKTIADLIELCEDEVQEILQAMQFHRSKVRRAMNALKADLDAHNQRLAG